MDKLPLVEFSDLNEELGSEASFRDVFSLVELDEEIDAPETSGRHLPMRLNALLMVLTLEGFAEITLDYIPYTVKPNTFVVITPAHIFQLLRGRGRFKGFLIVASHDFLESCRFGKPKQGHLAVQYMEIKRNPLTELKAEEVEQLINAIRLIQKKMKEKDHFFQEEAVQNAFIGFLLDVANTLISKKELSVNKTLSHKEQLFERFLELLMQHAREQHLVSFYAEKLCITSQYLSLILREFSGKSANRWIDDAILMEAKALLKTPNITVQQVAEMLHFSDQSTFGKFFKKHMGISPLEYRKS